jgi:hypothetical protein
LSNKPASRFQLCAYTPLSKCAVQMMTEGNIFERNDKN